MTATARRVGRRWPGAALAFAAAAIAAAPGPAHAADAVSEKVDAAHTGLSPEPLAPPLGKRWERPVRVSTTPLAAEGRVYFASNAADGPRLRALDPRTGADLWVRTLDREVSGSLAFDAGRVLARTNDGVLRAFSAADGTPVWERRIDAEPDRGAFVTAPVAADGVVYLAGRPGPRPASDPADEALRGPPERPAHGAYAFRSSDGAQVWAVASPEASGGLPALDAERVFVPTGCRPFALRRRDGAPAWEATETCGRSGAVVPVVAAGRVFVPGESRGVSIYDAATGADRGRLTGGDPSVLPAGGLLTDDNGLVATGIEDAAVRWRRADLLLRDEAVATAGAVWMRDFDRLLALDPRTGAERWRAFLPDTQGPGPGVEMTIGGGLLLVPGAERLTAFAAGPNGPGLTTLRQAPEGAALSFNPFDRDPRPGARVGFRISTRGFGPGVEPALVLERDVWPFDGRWEPVELREPLTASPSVLPERNTRYRVVAPDYDALVSAPVTLYTDYAAGFRFKQRGSRLTTRILLRHPAAQRVAGRRLHFYLTRRRGPAVRKASSRLRRRSATTARTTATFRVPRFRRGDSVFVCIPERRDDGFGRHTALSRACGRARL